MVYFVGFSFVNVSGVTLCTVASLFIIISEVKTRKTLSTMSYATLSKIKLLNVTHLHHFGAMVYVAKCHVKISQELLNLNVK